MEPLTPSYLLYGHQIVSLPYNVHVSPDELADPNYGDYSQLKKARTQALPLIESHSCHQDSNRWLKNSLRTNSNNCGIKICKPSKSVPTPRKELKNAHNIIATPTLADVSKPRDDAVDTEDDEMDVIDHDLELEFKLFYQVLWTCHWRIWRQVTVRVNLSELTLRKLSYLYWNI